MTAAGDRPGEYRTPARAVEAELKDRGSRFLAFVHPVTDAVDAEAVLAELRQRFRDASHHCWAWRLGEPAVERASDDGEPAGTAGKPMLLALGGVSDVVAVVVRWFGGTKLGKGGLARAYGGAVREALIELPTVRRFPTDDIELHLSYDQVGALKRVIDPPEIELLEEVYGEGVIARLRVARYRREELVESLRAHGVLWNP